MAASQDEITFAVAWDDMYYMQMWCSACPGQPNLLSDLPQRWDTEWPLEQFNQMAAAHLREVHEAGSAGPQAQVV